jgi:virginiamycin B lyase
VRRFWAAATTFLLAACSAGSIATLPAGRTAPNAAAVSSGHTAALILHIKIPKREHPRRGLRPAYVSPSTQGMTVAFSGPSRVSQTIGLTRSSPGCTAGANGTVCSKAIALSACPTTANCYIGSIATYDAISCTGSNCTIPPGAHVLSANQDVGFSVARGRSNALDFTLAGVPASVRLLPGASSALASNSAGGLTVSKCVTTPQSVSVIGVDADGNDIVGPGAPASPALHSNDTTHLAVATPPPGSNTFQLVPPSVLASSTIPNAGTVVQLTASVTPLAGTGAAAPTSHIDVAFNGDICGIMSEYPIPTAASNPSGIATGPDGALWFTEQAGNKIGRITTNGTITGEVTVPTSGSRPEFIVPGPDGALWFTEGSGNNIGRITTAGTITNEFPVLTASSEPFGITAGPDGALWFAEAKASNIGRITTGGTVSEYATPTTPSFPATITVGPDGALWFTELRANQIGRITTAAAITEYGPTGNEPVDITTGADGALWFTEAYSSSNAIGRITLGGTITQTGVPTAAGAPAGIALGPDGAVWFTEEGGNKVGRITTAGIVTEYPIPTSSSAPLVITMGPDGALWFMESTGNNVGRLQ